MGDNRGAADAVGPAALGALLQGGLLVLVLFQGWWWQGWVPWPWQVQCDAPPPRPWTAALAACTVVQLPERSSSEHRQCRAAAPGGAFTRTCTQAGTHSSLSCGSWPPALLPGATGWARRLASCPPVSAMHHHGMRRRRRRVTSCPPPSPFPPLPSPPLASRPLPPPLQGIKLGVSSRGWASLKSDPAQKCIYVDDDFELITFDFVTEPSTRGAYLVPVQRHFKKAVPDQVRCAAPARPHSPACRPSCHTLVRRTASCRLPWS